jgi:hypothetical protein
MRQNEQTERLSLDLFSFFTFSTKASALFILTTATFFLLLSPTVFAGDQNQCKTRDNMRPQSTPCIIAQPLEQGASANFERNQVLQRKLDHLAAQGYGLIQEQAKLDSARGGSRGKDAMPTRPNSRYFDGGGNIHQQANIAKETELKNRESGERLNRKIEEIERVCGQKLINHAVVGMRDEFFRSCTIQARFNPASQIVVSKDGNIPLRLYIFHSDKAGRVYVIDGVISAVKNRVR